MSNLKFAATIKSHADALKFLNGRTSKRLAYETYVQSNEDGSVSVYHHRTAIITYTADGTIHGNNGGYHSSTTRNRLHALTPSGYRVFQRDYGQYIGGPGDVAHEYARTFTIHSDGTITTDLNN